MAKQGEMTTTARQRETSGGYAAGTDPSNTDLETALFHLEFGKDCLREARSFDPSTNPEKRVEYLTEAANYLASALDYLPTNPEIHKQIGMVEAAMGNFIAATSSFRSALVYGPDTALDVLRDLQMTSRINEQDSPGAIPAGVFAVQESLMRGRYDEAFRSSVAVANEFLTGSGEFDRWSLQLMRVAAIASQNERTYVDYLVKFEDRGLVEPYEVEYHPKTFILHDDLRAQVRHDDDNPSASPVRSTVWTELEKRGESMLPVNRVAVSVGKRPLEGVAPVDEDTKW